MSIDVETIDPAEIAYRDKRIAELKTENERLRPDAEAWNAWKWILSKPENQALKKENERLRKQVTGMQFSQVNLREDAERYRWLRDNPEHESLPYYAPTEDSKWHFPYQIYGHGGTGGGVALRSFDTLDAAIDAAREGE